MCEEGLPDQIRKTVYAVQTFGVPERKPQAVGRWVCEDSEICGATPGDRPVSQPSYTLTLTLVVGVMINPTSHQELLGLGLLTAVEGLVYYFSISCACKQRAEGGLQRMNVEG